MSTHPETGRDESESERIDRNLQEMIGELRVALPGVQVLFAFLPPRLAWQWRPVLEQYGFILLLLLFFILPIGGQIIRPILRGLFGLLVGL